MSLNSTETCKVHPTDSYSTSAPGIAATEIFPHPDIELRTLVLLTLEDLGGGVRRAPAPRGQRLPRLEEVPESKIYKKKQTNSEGIRLEVGRRGEG